MHGRVELNTSGGENARVRSGEAFGTSTLLSLSGIRQQTAKTVTYCEMYVISKQDLENVVWKSTRSLRPPRSAVILRSWS